MAYNSRNYDYRRYYPAWVYTRFTDKTQENMRKYDLQQQKVEKRCLELYPDFGKKTLYERYLIRSKVEKELGFY